MGKKLYILWNPNYVTSWKRQNYEDHRKISGCQVFSGKEEQLGGTQRHLRAVELLSMTR